MRKINFLMNLMLYSIHPPTARWSNTDVLVRHGFIVAVYRFESSTHRVQINAAENATTREEVPASLNATYTTAAHPIMTRDPRLDYRCAANGTAAAADPAPNEPPPTRPFAVVCWRGGVCPGTRGTNNKRARAAAARRFERLAQRRRQIKNSRLHSFWRACPPSADEGKRKNPHRPTAVQKTLILLNTRVFSSLKHAPTGSPVTNARRKTLKKEPLVRVIYAENTQSRFIHVTPTHGMNRCRVCVYRRKKRGKTVLDPGTSRSAKSSFRFCQNLFFF